MREKERVQLVNTHMTHVFQLDFDSENQYNEDTAVDFNRVLLVKFITLLRKSLALCVETEEN